MRGVPGIRIPSDQKIMLTWRIGRLIRTLSRILRKKKRREDKISFNIEKKKHEKNIHLVF